MPDSTPIPRSEIRTRLRKIAGAGAAFEAGATAINSQTVVASLVHQLTGSAYAVGAASAVLRVGWLAPQLVVGFLADRARRRMPYYKVGAFGRTLCAALIALLLMLGRELPDAVLAAGFLVLWTMYAFVSGIVAVPYNDIVGRSIPSDRRSRMLAWRFFGGGVLALGVAAAVRSLLDALPSPIAYSAIFALAAMLLLLSAILFVSAGEPPIDDHPRRSQAATTVGAFLRTGWGVLCRDTRFRLFLYVQWLGAGTQMALPFYVLAAAERGVTAGDVGLLLGAQTLGALASNALWGWIGDRLGKLPLMAAVGVLRLVPPTVALALLDTQAGLPGFVLLFVVIGALTNGMTIAYLGYLMEISPDDRRPAWSAYFNALAAPAALSPLLGAALVEAISIGAVFMAATLAALVQLWLIRCLSRADARSNA